MSDLSIFHGPNAGYVLELYDRYVSDPSSVGADWQTYFAQLPLQSQDTLSIQSNGSSPVASAAGVTVDAIVGAGAMAQAIREYGHLAAALDPLGAPRPAVPDLEMSTFGVTEADLSALPPTVVGGPISLETPNASVAMTALRGIYCGAVGFDFDHVHVPEERSWLVNAVETRRFSLDLERSGKRALLRRLTDVEAFEQFLHQVYIGQKRFSIEGNDVLVPMLDEIVHTAAADGVREIVIGMAHRGRLNVMAHVLGKPYFEILGAFEGARWRQVTAGADADAIEDFSGDVKYHLGARLLRGEQGVMVEVPMILAPNPSHLEAVNPVVLGMVRATQDKCDQPGAPVRDNKASIGTLIHGDAAFPGQGVVAESLNLSALEGNTTGGTIHIIVNNQIGFTTLPSDSRSTLYAGDLAKGFEIPVVHVNADDPEACLMAVRMAIEYREAFGKDFLIDLIGYRRWGHNEGDEPSFTQPLMYAAIDEHPTVRKLFADQLLSQGVVTEDEPAAMLQASLDHLAGIRRSIADGAIPVNEDVARSGPRTEVPTAIEEPVLREYHEGIHAYPDGFTLNAKLARQFNRRYRTFDSADPAVDWAHAESLAFAGIISDGIPIRFIGQDAERGTFSQRHLVLHDAENGARFTPLQHLQSAQASFAIYNSALSEEAALGFEYGYSVQAPSRLVIWEAQFGDFANGAQVMIDQFISAARSKWLVQPSLVLLLPHGYEGQGPEHSSARLERFLQIFAQDNIRVVNCTTSAQYFHLLRRQALRLETDPRPLVMMAPKSLLRNPAASSQLEDFTTGSFKPVIDDLAAAERRANVTRLVLCSGKIAIDLDAADERSDAEAVAIIRVEQLAPFQRTALAQVFDEYPNAQELLWVQEEPKNMGAWSFMEPRLRELAPDLPIRYNGRPERASPAEGAADLHKIEQARIVSAAFADPPALPGSNGKRNSRSTTNGATSKPAAKTTATKAAAKARS